MAINKGSKPNKPKPSQTVANRASKNVQQRKQGSKMFGAVGGYGGVNKNMVRQLINSTVRPELMAMRHDRQYVNRQARDATQDANQLYNRSVGDLNYVFGEAGDYIGSLGQQINSGYDQTAQKIAGANAAGQAQMQANTDATAAAIQNQLQGLGLGGVAGVDPRLMSDAAFSQNQAVQQGTNEAANLAASQQAANTVTGLLGGMIAGSKASNLGQAAQNHMTGINDINRAKREDKASINDAMLELRAQKPGMIRDMLLQLQAQGFDQWQAIQSLNLSRRAMNMDAAQDSAYYGTAAQAWGAQAGASPTSPGRTSTGAPGSFNPVWTPNGSGGKPTNGGTGKGGRKGPRRGSGSQNDAIYGPLAGGYS